MGTTEVMRTVVFSTDQVRTVVEGPRVIAPVPLEDVFAILTRRYETLRVDPERPVVPPVADAVVQELFTLCRGDLRGTMVALHVAAHELLSYGRDITSPLTLPDVRAVLRERYTEQVRARLGADAERLAVIAGHLQSGETFAQKDAARWWGVSQTETSRTIAQLVASGYVIEVSEPQPVLGHTKRGGGRRGPRPRWYALGGGARLVFDPLPPLSS